jgi:hypothetical protein
MANISLTLSTNGFFGSVLMSPIQMGSLSVNNSVTNFSRLGSGHLYDNDRFCPALGICILRFLRTFSPNFQKRSEISCKQYHENVPSVLYIGDNWPLFSYSPIFSQGIFAKILIRQFSFQPCSRYML